MGAITDLLRAALARGDTARYELRETDPPAAWTFQGECCRLLGLAIPQVERLEDAAPAPNPPSPAPAFVAPLDAGAVFGRTKWLAGSLGCDGFVERGRPVVAPTDCLVKEILGGVGVNGGAELILATADLAWAWRYRHVAAVAGLRVGDRVPRATTVATVYDTSLDQLGRVPAWAEPLPDGWQHLDLSVNRGTDRFAPTGGGGGNVSAYDWLKSLGYRGRELARTPGPPDAGWGLQESMELLTPRERR